MRERIARAICLLSLGVVATLSYLFARQHNPIEPAAGPTTPASAVVSAAPATSPGPGPRDATGTATTSDSAATITEPLAQPSADTITRGRAVYARNGCATCHSIAGEGNPRYPLDGTGDRWEPEDLRDWIIGSGIAADLLNDAMRRRKQRYANLPEADLSALVDYLATLKAKP